jgi:hypothetical protein
MLEGCTGPPPAQLPRPPWGGITLRRTSPHLKVAPVEQVQVSGLEPRPHGLPRLRSMKEAGWKSTPLVQTHWLGSSPWQGLRSLLSTRLWMTGLLMMFLTLSWSDLPRAPPPSRPCRPARKS